LCVKLFAIRGDGVFDRVFVEAMGSQRVPVGRDSEAVSTRMGRTSKRTEARKTRRDISRRRPPTKPP
jgi:hypothetical protein